MARGYTSPVAAFNIGWEAEKKGQESAPALLDMSNEQTKGLAHDCVLSEEHEHERHDGAVQAWALVKATDGLSIATDEEHGSHEAINAAETMAPKIRIAPVPSRLRMYVPPANFGAVEEGSIYRSAYPQPKNYSFLESLHLKTILTLVPEPLPKEYLEFIHEHGIRHLQIHIPANKDGEIRITPERMCMALSMVLDRSLHPLLIHCNRGKHRTGCVIACLRKVQTLNTDAAIAEYRDYSYPKCRDDDQRFIRSFDPLLMLSFAQSKGWPITPPPEPRDETWKSKKDSFIFSLEDIAACKLPEEFDQSL